MMIQLANMRWSSKFWI